MEILMRILAMTILTIATVLTATAALAQTYDPKYPVCLQVYQGRYDFHFECAYASLAQCNMSVSGRAAQWWSIHIMPNPLRAKNGPASNGKLHVLSGLAAAAPVGWSIPSLIAPRDRPIGGVMKFLNDMMGGVVAPVTTGYIVGHRWGYAFPQGGRTCGEG
jgi:hypothetical protein